MRFITTTVNKVRPLAKAFNLPSVKLVLLVCVGLTLALVPTGLENWLAHWAYIPSDPWAWQMREYATFPAIFISLLLLVFLLFTKFQTTFPTLKRVAVVWLVAGIIGGGIANQVIVKEIVERPRPRESVLIAPELRADSGYSFPSGHASMGFIFAAPFFALRRKRPTLAKLSLFAGLAAGTYIGYARMVAGAHFATDIIWAGAFTLITAAVTAHLYAGRKNVPWWIVTPVLVLIGYLSFKQVY